MASTKVSAIISISTCPDGVSAIYSSIPHVIQLEGPDGLWEALRKEIDRDHSYAKIIDSQNVIRERDTAKE